VDAQAAQKHVAKQRHAQHALQIDARKYGLCILELIPRYVAAIRRLNAPRATKFTAELPKLAAQVPFPNTLHRICSIVKKSEQLTAQVATVHTLHGLNIRANSIVAVNSEVLAPSMAPKAALYLHRRHLFLAFIVH
jgi:hypothetical protein